MSGQVEAGFEPVREAFDANVRDLAPGGGAFCVYAEGRPVVDLWAGDARPGTPWSPQTLTPLLSATKGLVTTCAMLLVDRGLLELDAPVARYWPEFAAAGKGTVTVRQLLGHRAGLTEIPDYLDLVGLDGKGWDRHDEWAERLAAATPSWEPGSRHGYHALTYGTLVGELLRRLDGRRLGTFFRDEVAAPLGVDLHLGVPDEDRKRLTTPIGFRHLPEESYVEEFRRFFAACRDETTAAGRAFLARDGVGVLDVLDELLGPDGLVVGNDGGSGDGTGTAAGLARVYALLVAGGELEGVRLLSPETVAAFAIAGTLEVDAVVGQPMAFGVGFQTNYERPGVGLLFGPGPRTFGHSGAGGQLGFCDPEHGLAFALVRSRFVLASPLTAHLVLAVYRSVGAL